MKHGIGQNDLVMKLRIESRIADPEGADRQMGIVGREISKRAVREVVDNGYAATAREQQIDQRRSKKPRPPVTRTCVPVPNSTISAVWSSKIATLQYCP